MEHRRNFVPESRVAANLMRFAHVYRGQIYR
jgi:hypothetical protein